MFDGSTMRGIREAVAAYAGSFDPGLFSAVDAQKVLDDAVAVENMVATVKALAARRVADTELWKRDGDLSAAHQLARKSGTSITKAREALETAGQLSSMPELDAAARGGEVSASQAGAIADAVAKNPKAENRLVRKAKRASLGELLDDCAREKASAERDPDARHRAIHASRFLRRRRSADGAGELFYRSTLDEVGEIFSVIQGFAQKVFEKARAEGRREPEEAYLADGLLNAVRAGAGAAKTRAEGAGGEASPDEELPAPVRPATAVLRIDWDSFIRGYPLDGELCEIAGVGPVPVSVARAMIDSGDMFLAAVVTKGKDVVNVAHLGRSPNAWQRSALQWLNPTCTAEGCNNAVRLEMDHREPWADTKVTLLRALDRPCGHHHDPKTYQGWEFVEGTGKRPMVAPDDPCHPKNTRAGPAPPEAEDEVA